MNSKATFEKILHANIMFWGALFYLLDEEKKTPLRNGEVIDALIDVEDEYYLQFTETTARIVKDGLTCKYVKRFLKDDFPYTKLFDWYIKETVLKEK